MLSIKIATLEDFYSIRDFYHQLIDSFAGNPHRPKWVKGVYPSDEYLKTSLIKKELLVGFLNGKLCAAMVVNQSYPEEYNKVFWKKTASKNEVSIIHALGISPIHMKKGLASEMIKEVINIATLQKHKAIRLDVLADNFPAIRLYEKLNFHYIDTIQIHYPDTGWEHFKIYEYPLSNENKSLLIEK